MTPLDGRTAFWSIWIVRRAELPQGVRRIAASLNPYRTADKADRETHAERLSGLLQTIQLGAMAEREDAAHLVLQPVAHRCTPSVRACTGRGRTWTDSSTSCPSVPRIVTNRSRL